MNVKMTFSDLNFNLKSDFPERTIYIQTITRGDNKVKKDIFVGVKMACVFNSPTNFEFVFDHGYAGDIYGLNDVVNVLCATTSKKEPTHQ